MRRLRYKGSYNSLKALLFKSAIFGAAALGIIACNGAGGGGNLKVSGGTADGSGSSAVYPGTVYVDMTGKDFNGNPRTIRNVGNLVDLQLPGGQLTLVLSLADVFVNNGGVATLPLFKTVDLKIYLSNGGDPIVLPGLVFQNDGSLVDGNKQKFTMVSVGLEAKKIGSSDVADDKIRSAAQKLFIPSPLLTAKGLNVREPVTTYQLIAIPRSVNPALQSIKAPTLVASDDARRSLASLTMVGFGDTSVGSAESSNASKGFGLSAELPNISKRNFAAVTALNTDPSKYTRLRKLWGESPAVVQQVWEVSGSGLCGANDKDQSNYDTGAGVYAGPSQLVGFAVHSSAISANYRGTLDCTKTIPSDMATVVVSPNSADIAAFKALVK